MAKKSDKAGDVPVHKVIMIGSGGVGKSALTLQFMYDEVSSSISITEYTAYGNDFTTLLLSDSLLKIMNLPRPTAIERRWYFTAESVKSTS